MFSAASQIAEAEISFGALYLYYFLLVFKSCFCHITESAPAFLTFITHFNEKKTYKQSIYIYVLISFVCSRLPDRQFTRMEWPLEGSSSQAATIILSAKLYSC